MPFNEEIRIIIYPDHASGSACPTAPSVSRRSAQSRIAGGLQLNDTGESRGDRMALSSSGVSTLANASLSKKPPPYQAKDKSG